MHAAILRYFSVAARTGSLRRASEELNVAASALSRQIHKLEDELGVQVFERLPTGLRLTPGGRVLLDHAERTLVDFEVMRSALGAMRGQNTGTVRLATLDSLLVDFLPRQLTAFHRANPAVDFRVQSGAHGRVTALVAEGEADIGITFDLTRPDDLDLVHDVPMPIMAMMAPGHPLAREPGVTLAACLEHNLLLQLDTQPIRSLIEIELSALRAKGRVLATSDNLLLLKPMIMAGLGIAFFTPIGFLPELDQGAIVAVPLSGTRLKALRLGLVLPRRRPLTHATRDLAAFLGRGLALIVPQHAGTAP